VNAGTEDVWPRSSLRGRSSGGSARPEGDHFHESMCQFNGSCSLGFRGQHGLQAETGLNFVTPTARARPAKVSVLADFFIARLANAPWSAEVVMGWKPQVRRKKQPKITR